MALHGHFRRSVLGTALAAMMVFGASGCMGPAMGPAMPDTNWQTDYEDALSPHTQLALGILKALKEEPERVPVARRAELTQRWQALANLIEAKAPIADINAARRAVEALLDRELLAEIKDEHTTRGDLMGFMMSSGVRIPKGGMSSLNPDHVAAVKTVEALNKKDR